MRTPIDLLQEAIEKLEASKPLVDVCPDYQYEAVRHIARNVDLGHECEREECGCSRYETAPALDMLVRTIDAQAAVLRSSIEWFEKGEAEWPQEIWQRHPEMATALQNLLQQELALARAVLGVTTDETP